MKPTTHTITIIVLYLTAIKATEHSGHSPMRNGSVNDNQGTSGACSELRLINDVIIKPSQLQRNESTHVLREEIIQFLMSGHRSQQHALRDAVRLALLRLNYIRSFTRCTHHHQSGRHSEHLNTAVDMILLRSRFHDKNYSINSENLIKLANRILEKAFTIHKCCQQPNSQLTMCLKPPKLWPPMMDIETTMHDIRQIYSPHVDHLEMVQNKEKYLLNAFKYRLECWDEHSLELESRMLERVPDFRNDGVKSATSLLILRNILYGIPLRPVRTGCPVNYINNVFGRYADPVHHDQITHDGLQRLLHDLDLIKKETNDDPILRPGTDNADGRGGQGHRFLRRNNHSPSHSAGHGTSNYNGGQHSNSDNNGDQHSNSDKNGGQHSNSNNNVGQHSNSNNNGGQHSNSDKNGGQHSNLNNNVGQQSHVSYNLGHPPYPQGGLLATRPGQNSNGRNCLNADDLLDMFQAKTPSWFNPHTAAISLMVFKDMCPIILDQILSGSCRPNGTSVIVSSVHSTERPMSGSRAAVNTTVGTLSDMSGDSKLKTYLYSSLAVFIISLCSISGALFMKLSGAKVKTYMMASMLSLAVGCLIADAVLHLLPEILVEEGEHSTGSEGDLFNCNLKRMCVLLASLYGFFVLELLMSRHHSHDAPGQEVDSNSDKTHRDKLDQVRLNYVKPLKETNVTWNNELRSHSSYKNTSTKDGNEIEVEVDQTDAMYDVISNTDLDLDKINSRSSNIVGRKLNAIEKDNSIKPVAWMIMVGDGIHNVADGLAIGAAFSLSFAKGLSTSITVLCHEVPHELGDFAVLIDSGLSIKKAMLLNFLSSLTAFAGLYAGLSIGAQEDATKWIFTVGTGLFLYVALADLVPECKEYFRKTRTVKMFISQNVGILLGFTVMLLLALYEDKMEIKI